MSFFPSADPEEDQTPYVESQHLFPTPNTTHVSQYVNNESVEYNLNYATTTHGLPNVQAAAWASGFNAPQGLGLQYPPASFPSGHLVSDGLHPTHPTSFSWPADFTPTNTPVTPAHCFRRSSCSDCYQPAPTVQPSQLWEPIHVAADPVTVGDTSPEQSEFSASSYQSASSSPFVHTAPYTTTNSSPFIKTESGWDVSSPRENQPVPALHEIPAVETQDFAVLAPRPQAQQASASFLSPSSSVAEDVKPILRPGYRRAYSAADTEDFEGKHRRKRSLTRPENASCSCDICGKLFQRWYNLKAHMDTHDANRSVPNKCRHPGCGKRFVRRTDLVRHNESVHIKSRPFACTRCDNTFARKDTLQRHLDDGCPMRPEVRKRVVKTSRARASPPIKEEPMPQTPESQPTLSPTAVERLRRS